MSENLCVIPADSEVDFVAIFPGGVSALAIYSDDNHRDPIKLFLSADGPVQVFPWRNDTERDVSIVAAAGNDDVPNYVLRWQSSATDKCFGQEFAYGDNNAVIIASLTSRASMKPWSAPPPHFSGAQQTSGSTGTLVFGAFLGVPTRLVIDAHRDDETPLDYLEVKEGSHGDTLTLDIPAMGSAPEDKVYFSVSATWRDESNRLHKLAGSTIGAKIGDPWFSAVWGLDSDNSGEVPCVVLIWFGH